MADFDTFFDQTVAPMLDSVPADETAIEAAAPTDDTMPADAIEAEAPADAAPAPDAEPAPQAVAADPVLPVWESDANPYFAEVQKQRALQEHYQRAQAEKLRVERIKALSDEDPARAREIADFVMEQQHPLMQQVQAIEHEAEIASKLATVIDQAVRLHAAPEVVAQIEADVRRMMALQGGPDLIASDLETRRAERERHQAALAALRQENEELRRQVEARATIAARSESGVDRIDSSTGATGPSASERLQQARGKGFDAFFDTWATDAGVIPRSP